MRSVVYFKDFVTDESVRDLISKLENLPEVDLFINSGGGDFVSTFILIHFLNSHPDLHIYMIGEIGSSITFILLNFNGKITLTRELEAILFHAVDRQLYQIRGTKENIPFKVILDSDNNKYFEDLKKHFSFSDSEIKKLKRGDDLTLYQGQFTRFTQKPNIRLS